jgi:hydantoinase/carbamoylase family amidase
VVPDPDRIAARLQALWEVAQGPGGGADRPAYSPAEAQAMRLVAGWAAELGLAPAVDPHGNLWALPPDTRGPLVTSGSHVDTVPDGGRYDGALGTVLGLELVADLAAAGETRAGLLVCAAEEAPRFGAGTVGSRLLTGALAESALDDLHDDAGVSARDARDGYLAALGDLPRVNDPPTGRVRAHAEVHVALRFGPPQLGIVTRVASPRRLEVVIDGEPGHAGEVAMDERHDALAAAAEVVLAVERAALAEPAETVATVGTLTVTPGAVSVIPGAARLGIDMRAIEGDSLDRLQQAVDAAVGEIAEDRGVQATVTLTREGSPVAMDPELASDALRVAREHGIGAVSTWSGAGHDAQHINGLVPSLLMFVPLHDGQSHTPQEGAQMAEILNATEVVAVVMGAVIRQM